VRISLQPSYILHARPYRDSSMLLEAFTAEQGRISLVARGARRRSRGGSAGAVLQPFIPLLLSFSGRSELKNLNSTETAGSAIALAGERLFSGLYLNELLVRLLHRNDAHPRLFAAYAQTLESLARADVVDGILRRFEFDLLAELGYGFSLDLDGLSGEAVDSGSWYYYHPDWGLVMRDDRLAAAQPVFAGADLLAMARDGFDGPARATAKRLLRQVLATHLGAAPLRSRELFRPQRPATGSSKPDGGRA
jgi:DNA repair protein RecO (recombination protein O)